MPCFHKCVLFFNKKTMPCFHKCMQVSRDGRVVSETTYRMYWTRREQQLQMHEILAKAILNKTLDMERTRQAEIRNKIDEISKMELVRRVRVSIFWERLSWFNWIVFGWSALNKFTWLELNPLGIKKERTFSVDEWWIIEICFQGLLSKLSVSRHSFKKRLGKFMDAYRDGKLKLFQLTLAHCLMIMMMSVLV